MKIENIFKVGDKVKIRNKESSMHNETGIIRGFKKENEIYPITVLLDKNKTANATDQFNPLELEVIN